MKNVDLTRQRINDSIDAKKNLLSDEIALTNIASLADAIVACIRAGGKLVLCGNGGSASDALHFAGEIVGRFERERKAWPAVVLNADVATMTAVSNDYGFEDVYARQAEAHLKPNDLLIGISTSGNSENVYRAVLRARELGIRTAALLGKSGGTIAQAVDYPVIVPCNVAARIQECHITIIHILCEIVESRITESQKDE